MFIPHLFPDGRPKWVLPIFVVMSAASIAIPNLYGSDDHISGHAPMATPGPTSIETVESTVTLTPNPTQKVVVQSQIVKKIITKTVTVTQPPRQEGQPQPSSSVEPTVTPQPKPQPNPLPQPKPPPDVVHAVSDPVSTLLHSVTGAIGVPLP